MADISQITLPDGNTYDIKDANATTKSYVDAGLDSKQDTLTAGTGINIDSNNIISVTGGGGAITDVQVDGVSVVTSGVAEIDLTPYVETTDLATVATSGSYNDLTNQPSIYTQTQVDSLLDDKQDSLISGTISSGDLDDYTTIGHYYVNSAGASVVSNLPVELAGYVEVIQPSTTSGGARVQRYTAISSNSIVGVYERNFNNGAWQSWVRIDVESLLGGNITSGNLNTIRTVGNYYVSSTNVSNIPISAVGMLEVVAKDTSTTTAVIQRYTAIENNVIVGVYERVYVGGAWRVWKQIGEDAFLPLAGGTLTGDLYIEKTSPVYYTKKTGLTIDTSSDNGVSTDTSSYTIHADSTNSYFGRFRSTAYSDGRVASLVDARNMKSNGDRVANYLAVGVNKDGTRYFAFPNDSVGDGRKAFREALNIKDSPTVLELDITSSQSVSTGTYKSLGSFDLTAGTWIISYKAQFLGHDDTKLRRIMLTSSSDSNSPWADSRITVHASHDGIIDIGWTTMVRITSSSVTRYLTAYQNSGASLGVTGYVKAIKVINV